MEKKGSRFTPEEVYCSGRAEYLNEHKGYSLIEGYKIARKEWKIRYGKKGECNYE